MKTIVVTGASKGIGRELALRLADKHKVVAISRNEALLKSLQEASDNIYIYPIDIVQINKDDFDRFLIESNIESIDVLINNAGYLISKPFTDLNYQDYKASFDVNFYGTYNMIQCAYTYLLKSEKAHIVNISSVGGVNNTVKFPGLSLYSSSKGALTILSECLAEEFKESNVSVNCLALGAVQTDMLSEAFPGYEAPISSKEMAKFIENFALNDHQYMNGQVIKVALSTP